MKILFVNLNFLGDTILSTPVIAGIKQLYPNSTLSVMTTLVSSDLLKNDPFVDEVIIYDKRNIDKGFKGLFKKVEELKKKEFDMVYSVHRSHRTSVLLFLSKIPHRIGFKDAKLNFLYTEKRDKAFDNHAAIRNLSLLFDDFPKHNISQDNYISDLRLFEPAYKNLSQLAKNIPEDYIVMAPGSAWKTKQWNWQGYCVVAQYFIKQGIDIILIGSSDDVKVCNNIKEKAEEVIDFSGKIPVSDTMHIVNNTKLLVCNDSMSLHMASAFKTPAVAVFCATSPEFGFGPWHNPKAQVVEDETLDCKPCRRHGSKKCPNNTEACMKISPEIIIQACNRLI